MSKHEIVQHNTTQHTLIKEKIKKLIDALPEAYSDEAFVFMVLFRRKWAIRQHPEKEAEIRKLFGGKEICVTRLVVPGNTNREEMFELAYRSWLELPHKYILTRGKKIPTLPFLEKYPGAFNLVCTFEPRSLKKACQNFFIKLSHLVAQAGFGERNDELENFARNLDSEWRSMVHKSARQRGREKFVLVDVDTAAGTSPEEIQEVFEPVLKQFEKIGVLNSLKYYVQTPCHGMHFIFSITPLVQDIVFKKSRHFTDVIKSVLKERNIKVDEVEIKTGQILTHIGGHVPENLQDKRSKRNETVT